MNRFEYNFLFILVTAVKSGQLNFVNGYSIYKDVNFSKNKYYINPRNEERETITNSILEFTKVYFKDKPKFDKSILNGLNIIENQYHDSKKTKNKKEKPKDVNKKDDIKLIDKVSSDNKPITTEVVTNEFLDKKPLKKEQQLTLFK